VTLHPARAAARTVAVALLALLAAGAAATGASAHAQLVETTPADGATVGAVPAPVVLTFSDPIDATFVRVRATRPDGAVVATTVDVKGSIVEVTLPDGGSGAYTVVYRVVSKDGHPVSGRVGFTVAATTAQGSGTFAPATPSTSSPAATPQPTTSPGPTAIGSTTVTDTIDGDTGPGLPLTYLAGLVAVVVALGTAAWAAVARRGR
jgi:hypothetical protein